MMERRDAVDGINAVLHMNKAVEPLAKILDRNWLHPSDHEELEAVLKALDKIANRIAGQMVIH